jgi:hypothetical protein
MLNKNTQTVVNQLKDISPSVIFTYPITGIRDASKTIIAFVELDKLGEEEFEEFGVIKVREFMDLLNIAGDADITNDDGVLTIKSKDIKCRYVTTDLDVLEDSFRARPTMLAKVEETPSASTFTITANELDKIKRVSALLSLENFTVISKNDEVLVTVANSSINNKSESNDFQLTFSDSTVVDECSVLLSVANIRKLPSGNYDVKIAKSPNGNVIIRFVSQNIAGLTIFIATKTESN